MAERETGAPNKSDAKGAGGPRPRRSPARFLRPIPLILALVIGGFAIWKYQHRPEGYQGGDIVTTGTVEAVHVQLGFKVSGRLETVPVSEGDEIKAGQLIGRLEPQDLEVQVRAARASLETSHAALAQAQANEDKAARDLARMSELLKSDATTAQQMDATRAASAVSRAQVQQALAQVQQAESALAQAELQLSYAELRSSESGQISEKIHRPGEIVGPGQAVVTVAQLDTVKVLAPVDETQVGAIRPGDKVEVKVYSFDRTVFQGEVTDIETAGDFATRKDWGAQRRDIRTFTVTSLVPNPDHLLKDGMTAEVTVHVAAPVRKMVGEKP